MAVSGINTFNLVTNQIIDLALEEIGVKTFNRIPTNAEVQQAKIRLNVMIKHWKTAGINLWKSTQGVLFTEPGQKAYRLDGATANATEEYSFSLLSANVNTGASSFDIDDTIGFAIGYFIGIAQDDNTMHWTTITNIVGNTITIASALTADAIEGNYVYTYETKIKRPEGISNLQMFITPTQSISSVIYSNNSYFSIPTLETEGISNIMYYDKQLTYGTIYLWPVPNVNTYLAKFTFQKQFDDFVTATNNPDFPQEWLKALYLNLAVDLLRPYGKSKEDYVDLILDAKNSLDECNGYDREDTTIYFTPASTNNLYTYR